MRFARTAADEYAAMENGYHAKLRDFLRRAYHSYELFLQIPEGFEELKRDPFWQNSRQKPEVLNSSKWVLYFIMRATQSNDRARASKYARILDGLDREGVHVTEAANRIAKLGGVEEAYKRMVAAERGRAVSGADGDDEEMESEECLIPRRRKLRASRENDAKAYGEPMSPSQMNIDRAAGGRRPMPSYDPNRFLFVELGAAELKRVLDAGTKAKRPVCLRLEITVHPRSASGFPRVVGGRVSSIADLVDDTPFDPQPDLMSIDRAKAPLRSSVGGGGRERAPGVAKPTRNPWAGRKPSSRLRRRGTGVS